MLENCNISANIEGTTQVVGKSMQIDPLAPDETDPHRPFQIDPLIPAETDPLNNEIKEQLFL